MIRYLILAVQTVMGCFGKNSVFLFVKKSLFFAFLLQIQEGFNNLLQKTFFRPALPNQDTIVLHIFATEQDIDDDIQVLCIFWQNFAIINKYPFIYEYASTLSLYDLRRFRFIIVTDLHILKGTASKWKDPPFLFLILIVDIMPGSGVISIELGIESFPP